jgi:hypothetical protein
MIKIPSRNYIICYCIERINGKDCEKNTYLVHS